MDGNKCLINLIVIKQSASYNMNCFFNYIKYILQNYILNFNFEIIVTNL